MPSKLKVRSVVAEEPKQTQAPTVQKNITIKYTVLGRTSTEREVAEGTTLHDLLKQEGLKNVEARVNRQNVSSSTILQEKDSVVVLLDAIQGGKS